MTSRNANRGPHVYGKGMLDRFFDEVEQRQEQLYQKRHNYNKIDFYIIQFIKIKNEIQKISC